MAGQIVAVSDDPIALRVQIQTTGWAQSWACCSQNDYSNLAKAGPMLEAQHVVSMKELHRIDILHAHKTLRFLYWSCFRQTSVSTL